jgi:hypothetical protein
MRRCLAILALLCTNAVPARADVSDIPQLVVIPSDCVPFLQTSGGRESTGWWRHLLSLAACMQDATIGRIDSPAQLAPVVEELKGALVPSLRVYLFILEAGPDSLRLHALYQIGLAQVSLLVRARSSIVGSSDRYRELHAQLEPMLEEISYIAWLSFASVVRTARENPSLVDDQIARNLVNHAREMAILLRPPSRYAEPMLANRRSAK